MASRALVIGSQTGGLTGVDNDASRMADALTRRGFHVDLRTQTAATRAGILDGYQQLIAGISADDAAVVYYAGHGNIAIDTRSPGRRVQDIVPFDYAQSTETDYRGITATELSLLQRELTNRTRNVTVILDCCHSSQMSRGRASSEATPRALAHPLHVSLADHLGALEARYGQPLHELGMSGNPYAVRAVACAQSESAIEYTNARGERTGIFTEALLELLDEIAGTRVTWSVLGHAIRQRVLRRYPAQRPDVEGPTDRQLFSLAEQPSSDVIGVYPDAAGYRLDGGRLVGIAIEDRYEIRRVGEPGRPVARGVVTEVSALAARLAITEWLGEWLGARELPAGAVAIRVARSATRHPVRVIAPDSARVAITDAISRARTLRVAADAEPEPCLATLRVMGDRVTITDADGPLFPEAAYPAGLADAVQDLANLGVAHALRELEGEHGVASRELAIEWGVVDGRAVRAMPDHGAALGLGDRVYCRIRNTGRRRLHAHVFNIGLQGRITLLTGWAPSGVPLDPAGEVIVGEAFDGSVEGLALAWPTSLPRATFPRVDTLLVIVTSEPANLGVLQTVNVRARDATRSKGVSGLAQLLEQLQTGGTREIGPATPVEGYLAKSLSFLLHPRDGRMTSPEFLVDEAPGTSGAARGAGAWRSTAASAPRAIAIRLAELAIDDTHAWFAADIRVDALICTRPGEQEPGYRPETMRFSRMRSGDAAPLHNALLYHGPVRDFVDICLWVSRDTDRGAPLAGLLAARAQRPEVKDALGALLATANIAAGPWVTAVGASAVLARVAYEAILAASGTSIGLYRTSFLAGENYGIGRYPRSGLYRAQDFSFALVIDEVA